MERLECSDKDKRQRLKDDKECEHIPCIRYFDEECNMNIIITSTNELTIQQADELLSPILEKHYINKILSKLK